MEVCEGKGGITAKVVCDSLTPYGVRLTTMELVYPRFIHSEFMTHRMFSRNASSSRAIPVEKMIKQVEENPAMPIHWGKNQPGMQAREELTQGDLEEVTERCAIEHEKDGDRFAELPNWWYSFVESHEGFDAYEGGSYQKEPKTIIEVLEEEWKRFGFEACENAKELNILGLHKQIINRLLEPFQFIKVIVTSTEWDNFFKLRLHEDAQPEICLLAKTMREAMDNSIPKELKHGEWHTPYYYGSFTDEKGNPDVQTALKLSVARCARVSYNNHDNTSPNIEKDIVLADKLLESGHMSPFEHQAIPMKPDFFNAHAEEGITHIDKEGNRWSGNFRGWIQYRQLLTT